MSEESTPHNQHRGSATRPIGPHTLHQLRAPAGDFVGREDEITQIVQALHTATAGGTAATISGVSGVGKTELAHAVARQLIPDFPDAQVLIELRRASAGPMPPTQAL